MKKTKKSSLIIKILIIFFMIIIIPNLLDVLNAQYDYNYKTISAPPTLYIETKAGDRIELVLASYTLNTLDKSEEVELIDDYYSYDFKENNKLITFNQEDYYIKADEFINFENYEFDVIDPSDKTKFIDSSGGTIMGNMWGRVTQNREGEFLNIFRIYTTDNSFYGTYIYKELVVESNALYEAKKEPIYIEEIENVKKIINNLPYAKLLNDYNIDGKKITLEYDVQFSDIDLKKIAKTLFVCINDLEVVEINVNEESTYNGTYLDYGNYVHYSLPHKSYKVNKNDFSEDFLSIEKIREYLEK